MENEQTFFDVEDLLNGYVNGIFPMADADGTIHWYAPDPRAIIPIEQYKPSRSLRPILNKRVFDIRINTAFEAVMRGCALPRQHNDDEEDGTWISEHIIEVYTQLHELGYAHSVEAWKDGQLVGGLYGVCIHGAFFGESMFTQISNASKVAFHYLIAILKANDFALLDTQFMNENVKRYGAIEIPRATYLSLLHDALQEPRRFDPQGILTEGHA
ncbi:leucyl/phenylalanyl-tRNA--protein transferase [Dyadobacter jejuensis]|uniref:Leucyl/phenylalanyl-tRNA--protein transferase n=1 Tax=Dyadobacter jejuensis TaxID=1082580 RepID=A0A316ASI8_9BACT|nr:leucyl/phenylalanyl-tRNA--protein transferase [Dyadobacter jejuensis]PWJ60296.1 leucyl/phenylalanyl-tRNA--protein transferase [Dyadobacter jejuensis]